MATAKKAKTLKKARASRKAGGRHRRNVAHKGILGGIGADLKQNLNMKSVLDTVMKAGIIIGTIAGGRFIKKKFLKGDQEGIKKFIGPIIEIGGGFVLASTKNDKIKVVGYGLMADGLIDGINIALNKGKAGTKDVLNLETLKGLFGDDEPGMDALPEGQMSGDEILPLPDYNPQMRGLIETPEEESTFQGALAADEDVEIY